MIVRVTKDIMLQEVLQKLSCDIKDYKNIMLQQGLEKISCYFNDF